VDAINGKPKELEHHKEFKTFLLCGPLFFGPPWRDFSFGINLSTPKKGNEKQKNKQTIVRAFGLFNSFQTFLPTRRGK
jgi:hypothetical protein